MIAEELLVPVQFHGVGQVVVVDGGEVEQRVLNDLGEDVAEQRGCGASADAAALGGQRDLQADVQLGISTNTVNHHTGAIQNLLARGVDGEETGRLPAPRVGRGDGGGEASGEMVA